MMLTSSTRPLLSTLLVLATLSALLLARPPVALATGTVIYVNTNASGSNNGTNWTDAYPNLPDLIVEQINVVNGTLQVTIRNQGQAPVVDPFWADVYINPRQAPTGPNQIWNSQGAYGATWGVTGPGILLAPGASLTLTIGDQFYRPDYSSLPATLVPGTTIYAQVDSTSAGNPDGAVRETHERDATTYNNITQAIVPAGGVALPQSLAPVVPATADGLPAR